MKPSLRIILRSFAGLLKLLLVLCALYAVFIVGIVIWTFEVKLNRWPIFVYSAPFNIRVGDDYLDVRLLERLERLGYTKSTGAVAESGQWSQIGNGLNIHLNPTPFKGSGITTGPVSITLDWNTVQSIRLMRSLEDVGQLAIEPEIISIIPAPGQIPEFCRPMSLENMPPLLVDSVILTEDTNFFFHQGIDFVSIYEAIKANLKAGRYVQGGSTISQQLIRMTILSPEKTIGRKLNEIALALAADAIYSKNRILESYLNRVYFGQWGSYPLRGVSEAARHLFGKDLSEMDAAECALLAASIRAPNIINPYKHPDRARSRRNTILGLLFKAGKIQRDQYEEAVERPVTMRKAGASQVRAGAFVDLVREILPKDLVGSGSIKQDVLTSLDALAQNDSETLLKNLEDAHLILANPATGEIKAYISPPRERAVPGSLEQVLPIAMIPAFMSEQPEQSKYTLNSQIFVSAEPGESLTFREAFRKTRPLLIKRLIEMEGREKILSVLKEFDVKAAKSGDNDISVGSMTPFEMAQIYSVLAALGNAGILNPGVKIEDYASPTPESRKRVNIKPAVLFLINHLMKSTESVEIKDGGPDRSWSQPSVFKATDDKGVWTISYYSHNLLVMRFPTSGYKESRARRIITKILPRPDKDAEKNASVPEGIVIRKICVHSGLKATSICPRIINEPFLSGTQPTEWCSHRHESTGVRSEIKSK